MRQTQTGSILLCCAFATGCVLSKMTMVDGTDASGGTSSKTRGGTSALAGNAGRGGTSPSGGTTSTSVTAGTTSITTIGGTSAIAGATSLSGTSAFGGNVAAGGATSAGGVPNAGTAGAAGAGDIASRGGSSSTGGLGAAGGITSTGGTLTAGGSPATGGLASTGGSQVKGGSPGTGGTKTSGGTTANGGSAGVGCTGALEEIHSATGLCVAKMVTIAASTSYQIDVTEVTRGQYEAWVATGPALPAETDANCGWKYSGRYAADPACMDPLYVCQGNGCDHHPQVCVDWCDAYAYCQAVGKRLCGKIGGGAAAYASQADATVSQWHKACTSGGASAFPYGGTYSGTACNGYDYWAPSYANATLPVGYLTSCQSSIAGYTGTYDLSGNVYEWENCCSGSGSSGWCRNRGGGFGDVDVNLACGAANTTVRMNTQNNLGLRCCSG